ncbi:MAG: ABC transporter permease [Phycisphaerales bacterium]|nr:ABC transporter permease [Phycisphaerales bacterium]
MMLLRLAFQTLFLAIGQIWANKVRAMLTTLGIIIGVAAVVSTVAATNGLKNFVLTEFSSFGANKVWVFPRRPPEMRDRFSWRKIRLTDDEADGLAANVPSFERLTPVLDFTAPTQYHEMRKPFVPVHGIRPVWHDIEARFVTQGRPFSRIDEEEQLNVCLVNDKAIAELGLPTNCPGEYLLVDNRRFLIVGVVETKAVSPMFGNDDAMSEVFIPFRTARAMRPDGGIYVIAQTKRPELFEDARAETTFYMRRVRGLKGDDPDTFGVEAIEQVISQFNKIASGITMGAGGIVAISLLVGGIGIMNIMLVSVSERTREIGLRKAMGARPAVILLQFLVEAVVLCMIGGAVGLAIGQGITLALREIPNGPLKQAEIPAWAVALAVGFSATTGLIFGMFPAIKAARLDPIDALRHE